MKHFIITRFNDVFPSTNHMNLGINETWLAKRIKIFQENTLVSIANQTDKEFVWILKCHPQTPDWARDCLKSDLYFASYDEFPIQENPAKHYSFVFSKIIKKITSDKEIITTRLDSDDRISSGHIELVKKLSKPEMFFDFRSGLVKTYNGLYFHKKNGVSQFCSYFDTREFKTVYHLFHNIIKDDQCVIFNAELGWMQNNTIQAIVLLKK